MTLEKQNSIRKHSKKFYIFRIILLTIYVGFLILLYRILLDFGSSHLIAILIFTFAFLVFLGLLVKSKDLSLLSLFKRKKIKKENYIKDYEKYHPHLRRVDYVNLNLKYRKPIVRKCSNCGIVLAGFVKRCPNCGEKIAQ
ncbi:MAG: hypothetical protein ACFFB0_09375 [Promethearchaeota archaeon]